MRTDNYNPDVLTCLANLSNDEVFTPPAVVNRMLDMLPSELWSNPDARFLDPVYKTGVFLREIAKRLMEGLKEQIPDVQQRANHIFGKQLYGMAITELTALMSRRSVYCSKYANSRYSVCSAFDDEQGNIRYEPTAHAWQNNKCIYCGVTKMTTYDRSEEMERHAYQFIHTDNPQKLYPNMKFDVIIGNPPYQLNVGIEKENYAIPIYHKFIEQAKKLKPSYLTMIIPARWYAGGRGLDEFRDEMLQDNRIAVIHDYPESADCFPNVEIQGGVCYFLWDSKHKGDCLITTHANNISEITMQRPLLEDGSKTFVRYNQSVSIVRKVVRNRNYKSFQNLVSTQTPFGLITSYKGNPERKSPSDLMMYISGNEKVYKGGCAYTPIESITKGHEMVSWHKVYISKAYGGGMAFPHTVLGKPFYGCPQSVCNQSYLVIGAFSSRDECENVISYIKTKFFRFMVLQKKNSQDAMRGVYEFVPIQDFSEPWTDEKLYAKYGLTVDEINFIESMIRPME